MPGSKIVNNFLFGNADDLQDHTSLIYQGIMDSTGVLELVSYLEETFTITVEDEAFVPENLDSFEKITGFIIRKKTDTIGHEKNVAVSLSASR